ncbi:MAG: CRISPR-associated helicase/endonuclease Cas3 [bacterium]|nr:CRISPR-associated helicase/endonuclease Cas3 [bacterium]
MQQSVTSFYRTVLGCDPYPYQKRLADKDWPDFLDIPTGLGKTAAIFMAWAYKRACADRSTPRRLVWCLPMRVLVKQTEGLITAWSRQLAESGLIPAAPPVFVLMGGRVEQEWDASPEKDAVIIGTQDQLLSRALNRGYSMSRYRWPMDFALLNNDAFWVFDEVQLMGPGLTTSAQLEALRARFQTAGGCRSLWSSATLRTEWLRTVDFPAAVPPLKTATLEDDDKSHAKVAQRIFACKGISSLEEKRLSSAVLSGHRPGTLTLVIKNTVKSTITTYKEIARKAKCETLLLHSRFRPAEKDAIVQRLLSPPPKQGRIAITTQVVEAGVDISAATLFTDLAPWPSLVQRFGRCNRAGEIEDAKIFYIRQDNINEKNALPYTPEDLSDAEAVLKTLSDANPGGLPRPAAESKEHPTLRATDILDLFDTTPDLAGADIDISRFIRNANESDAQVFWRTVSEDGPDPDMPMPTREELCPVPVHELRQWLESRRKQDTERRPEAWAWDSLDGNWKPLRQPYPGMTILINAAAGGYDPFLGWNAASTTPVEEVTGLIHEAGQNMGTTASAEEAVHAADSQIPAMDGDTQSQSPWLSIEEHSAQVKEELERLIGGIGGMGLEAYTADLMRAALLHDWGKAHPVFQDACHPSDAGTLWAKAPALGSYGRKGFRHELASALAMLQNGESDLSAYLAASHHGKVRFSIRSMPNEEVPPNGARFARGIWEGDELPPFAGHPGVKLSLACMEFGLSGQGKSWADRMTALLEELGPFRLAYLETLLRTADWRASSRGGGQCQK